MTRSIISPDQGQIKDAAAARPRVDNAELIGQRFGRLLVTGRAPNNKNGKARWACLCVCGQGTIALGSELRSGHTKSRGCLLYEIINLLGQRFGRLLVIGLAPKGKRNGARWKCLCDCGQQRIVQSDRLRSGCTQSCGCLQVDSARTHGMTYTSTYRSYQSMLTRCTNPKTRDYRYYGSLGVRVCTRWEFGDGVKSGFECFLADMGPRPPGTSLDRVDPRGNYEPTNCRWAVDIVQQNNRRNNRLINWQGRVQTISQWARELKIKDATLRLRIKHGWPLDRALSEPVQQQNHRIKAEIERERASGATQ